MTCRNQAAPPPPRPPKIGFTMRERQALGILRDMSPGPRELYSTDVVLLSEALKTIITIFRGIAVTRNIRP